MRNRKNRLGKIHIYTGEGKGKTTASLGLAIRAAGHNKKVGIVYFDKGGLLYGERNILPQIKNIDFWVTGLVRFKPGKPFRFGVIDGDKQEVQRGLDIVRGLFSIKYDLIIMDEINTCVGLKMVPIKQILKLLDEKPKDIELVMTGRYCPGALKKRGDLITEMKKVKHYFESGTPARKGIEY